MRSKNKGLMEQIKTYAEEYAMSHGGATPSTRDIGAAFNMSHVSAYRYLLPGRLRFDVLLISDIRQQEGIMDESREVGLCQYAQIINDQVLVVVAGSPVRGSAESITLSVFQVETGSFSFRPEDLMTCRIEKM